MEKIRQEKNLNQKIRLITNQIAPDNFDKKFNELRAVIFGSFKHSKEHGFDPKVDFPISEKNKLNDENMKTVVESIFRKAQNEKEYCSFYGDLCERIIRLELALRGLEEKQKNLKKS